MQIHLVISSCNEWNISDREREWKLREMTVRGAKDGLRKKLQEVLTLKRPPIDPISTPKNSQNSYHSIGSQNYNLISIKFLFEVTKGLLEILWQLQLTFNPAAVLIHLRIHNLPPIPHVLMHIIRYSILSFQRLPSCSTGATYDAQEPWAD